RRKRKDEQSRRKRQPCRPDGRLRAEPAGRRVAEEFRGIERREIRSEGVVVALKGRPRRVHDEGPKRQEHDERLYPPEIPPRRLTKPARHEPDRLCRRRRSRHEKGPRKNASMNVDGAPIPYWRPPRISSTHSIRT